jgi:hypothetical protein
MPTGRRGFPNRLDDLAQRVVESFKVKRPMAHRKKIEVGFKERLLVSGAVFSQIGVHWDACDVGNLWMLRLRP